MGIPPDRHSENCHSEAPSTVLGADSGRGINFLSFSSNAILTAVALMLACLAAPAATAEELGRLFFTPQQRQDLDRRRATNRAEEEAPQIKEGPLTLDGHVQRSSGKTATWVNGVPQYDSDSGRDPTRVTVVPNAGEPGVSLKVGEVYERTSGEVRDNLNGGKITVEKPAPKISPDAARGAATKPAAPTR